MRLERLLHLVVLLANRKRIAAKELAERFGVSVRTIYRDIEAICQAGIPVVTYPGLNGGVGLAEGYRLDRSVFSEEELASALVALRGFAGAFGDPHAEAVQEKIWAVVDGKPAERLRERTGLLRIDHTGWDASPWMKERVELLKQAAAGKMVVRFRYGSAKGETLLREAEPYTLVLKNGAWYLHAYCLLREKFRLFKLSRMGELETTGRLFAGRAPDSDSAPWEGDRAAPAEYVHMVLRFRSELRLLAEDWFGPEAVETEPGTDGQRVLARVRWPEDEWLYGCLLSFGSRMEIVEPERLRIRIREEALRIAGIYGEEEKDKFLLKS